MPATPDTPHDPADWAQVRVWFDRLTDLAPAEREALLASAGLDPALLADLRSLLAHADTGADADARASAGPGDPRSGSGGFLARPAAAIGLLGADADSPADVAPSRIGQRLGPWQIDGLLGRGGMGEVWSAQRADGAYQGRAAIKVLRHGLDSRRVLDRFAQEQQALARLNHAHIARLLDAGRTDDGQPFFVMEAVDGRNIDRACAGLPIAQRLALFLQLADAVAHAHRQLLVHRDLKPGNVLVDADGQVKLLDFGIAKAIDARDLLAGSDGLTTVAGERPFTPHFASPEQVRGEPLGTATDIYSLGVLLYVMLTGQRPYGREATSALEAARSVLHDEPTRPSALSPGIGADPQWLAQRKRLVGDLDNILLKALDKRVDQRYPSVDALAADIRAHLAGFPVSARPPNKAYLAAKFVRRHKAAVAAGVAALLALAGGLAATTWQARIADAQRAVAQQRFKQVRQLANQLVFKYHDQIENLPGATQAREMLLVDAAGFLDQLDQAAADDPQLADELANTYYRISRLQGVDSSINTGRHDQAELNLDKALALTRRYVDRDDMPIQAIAVAINMHVSKGELWQRRGRMAEAEAALREGLPLLERVLRRDPKDTWALASAISLHGVLARLQGSNLAGATLGRWRDACVSADRARAAAEATIAADPANVYAPDSLAFTLGEQAQCQLLAGQADASAGLFTQQVGLRDRMAEKFPDDMDFRYQRSIARGNLARALSAQGRHPAARQTLDLATALASAAAQADPGNQAGRRRVTLLQLSSAELHLAAGDSAAARTELAAVLQSLPATDGQSFADARWRAEALLWSARAWRQSQALQALAWAQEAALLMQAPRPEDDNITRRWLLAQAQGEQAQALAQRGDRDAAARAAQAAMASWAGALPPDGPPPLLQPWIAPLQAIAGR